MGSDRFREVIQEILHSSGVEINGGKPCDIRIKNERFYQRVIRDGSVGLGESYMDGWWECESLDDFFCRIMPHQPEEKVKKNWKLLLSRIQTLILNQAGRPRAYQIGERHYDLGNELFQNMLDRRMVYSCAYWQDADNLDDAQEAKLDLICRKMRLKPGDKILDIGCGWGSLAKYAAEKYKVKVVGITVSKRQVELGRKLCKGLDVEIRFQDYRDIDESFDHVVSVGMFEHVGLKNFRTYMEKVHSCLRDSGLFLLQTIGSNDSQISTDPWFGKYIFPNSLIPSMKQISSSVERLFVIEDWHNFGCYYDNTLMSWFRNFDANWDKLKAIYDERFYRMWKYYLLSSAGTFRARCAQVWQIVFSKMGVRGGYRPVR
ncbi:MAG: cyclopropane fatty acyl phospholipid synthase [Nitrospirota bacterium]